MLSNNADEFVSGFRLRVIAVLGSDECAPRTARSTSSGALLLGAVVLEPVVVLVSLPCRSWSALKMEDMQSGLRFDGRPRSRRRTPPSHDWIFVPRPCRRASHTGSQAFAHATDEVPETRPSLSSGISAAIAADNHACRIPKLKYIGDARVGNEHLLDDGSTCISASRLQLCATSKAGWYAQLRVA